MTTSKFVLIALFGSFAASSAIAQSVPPFADELKAGAAAYEAKSYPEAISHLSTACDLKSDAACNMAATMYRKGELVGQDKAKAAGFAVKGCDLGSVNSCVIATMAFMNGDGVAKDESRSLIYSSKACDGGIAAGCNIAGSQYQEGLGVRQSRRNALLLYDKSCAGGMSSPNASGCKLAGVLIIDVLIRLAQSTLPADTATQLGEICGMIPDLNGCGVGGTVATATEPRRTALKEMGVKYLQRAILIAPNDASAADSLARIERVVPG